MSSKPDNVSESAGKKRKPPQPCGGSRKGRPNKSTAAAREAIARFVDGNAERLNDWLDQIERQDGPKAAFQCFQSLIEYHVPKLGRQELTGANGADLVPPEITVTFIKPK